MSVESIGELPSSAGDDIIGTEECRGGASLSLSESGSMGAEGLNDGASGLSIQGLDSHDISGRASSGNGSSMVVGDEGRDFSSKTT